MSTFLKSLFTFSLLSALIAAVVWLVPVEQRAAWLAMLPAHGKLAEPAPLASSGEGAEDEEALQRRTVVGGAPAVRLTLEEQQFSGIRTQPLERLTYRAESLAYGLVMDIQPLLELRARYGEAAAEQAITQARLEVSAQEYERLRALNSGGNIISASRMRAVQSRFEVDKARLAAAQMRASNIRAQTMQTWGAALTSEALDPNSSAMAALIEGQDVLLRITLASDASLPLRTGLAYIDRDGDRHSAREARYLSPAPRTDPAAQGETHFFLAAARDLRTGMRVSAWIVQDEAPETGVLLPAAAAVWYGGEPWVYVQAGEELFVRRAVPYAAEVAGGWLAHEGFEQGEPLVITGGQMLLSEEFRWQIPEEDDD
jgi:hypothetical protein